MIIIAGHVFRRFLPLFDRILVAKSTASTVAKGGIMLLEKSQGIVLQATVVAIQPVSIKVRNKVLLPKYGGTKISNGDILRKYVD
ncbi:unnamed protein product [Nyctereutes procyonoides]|uniref:(raccoon dog) hypothetical protein n=1 Tax=Nyctereutes procyonoides TaxID=34880 RepID=A0A811YL73_NYCPR|nr:unnamed protein product [Nyctereutes procyonoides]